MTTPASLKQPSKPRKRSVADVPGGWSARLFAPVPIDWLVFYRVAFGAVMLWYAWKYLHTGAVRLFYVTPLYHFPYAWFDFVEPIDFSFRIAGQSYQFIYLEFVCLAVAAFLILIGLFYRLATILFAICFVHIFLIDKCYYQNHYYLVSLLSVILPFLPAHRAFSVDAWLNPSLRSATTPAWTLWLMRFQIGVPYFFGGLAKINADWLRGQPMRSSLEGKVDLPWLGGPWFAEEWMVQSFVWGGLLFDLLIVPALLWKRTRLLAFVCCLVFHSLNSLIWTIGIFPGLMIAATTVFFEPDWPRRLRAFVRRVPVPGVTTTPATWAVPRRRGVVAAALTAYVGWQVLLPLRHVVMPGNPSWDESTHCFSWHMLLRGKESGLRIYATDLISNRTGTLDLRTYVTARQLGVIGRDPWMIRQLSEYIADDLESKGFPNAEVRVLALVALNGRKPQLMIDPNVDLSRQPPQPGIPDWIMPLTEPFRHDAWDYPLSEWEQHLDLDLPPQMLALRPSTQAETNTVAR